ncbi:MAG: sugar phosphate isomerase/epimerase [Opitutaceae bacterium]
MKLSPHLLSRRDAIKATALGLASLPFISTGAGAASATAAAPAAAPAPKEGGLRLGVATYSTRLMSFDDTISALKAMRIENAGVFRAHRNWETVSVDEARAAGEKLRAAGIALTGSGVVNFTSDEPKARQAFDNARAAGMATMVCKPALDALPLVEKLAKEYDQKLAIHNHGPEDKVFPSPQSVWDAIKNLDARIGFCIDVGHAMRAKADPATAIRQFASRLYDVHLKDSLAVPGSERDIPTEVGTGRMDIRGILHALREVKYSGVVALEYEKGVGNQVIGLAESVGYIRGMLATIP